ncbi:hypothetical protein THAOC_15759 [Thalassiosira oceanica]|uniref:RING-type domain-containing protein n=1 Tax=Thalassiosira oceanica TaxID=159749 RepID=K0SBR6_THAOC|nr:hypothetical protein THAOC_15759 [Thalassiosira oceanica]|eukprot:EJK63573.1 hypothetical protein THAOC_15759 [Thalassiosira oceanica]
MKSSLARQLILGAFALAPGGKLLNLVRLLLPARWPDALCAQCATGMMLRHTALSSRRDDAVEPRLFHLCRDDSSWSRPPLSDVVRPTRDGTARGRADADAVRVGAVWPGPSGRGRRGRPGPTGPSGFFLPTASASAFAVSRSLRAVGGHKSVARACESCLMARSAWSSGHGGKASGDVRSAWPRGNQLVLMKKGRTRSEGDDCPICQLPLPLDISESLFRECCMTRVCKGCALAARKRGMRDCPFCRAPPPKEEHVLAMVQARVDKVRIGEGHGEGRRVIRACRRARGERKAHFNLGVTYAIGDNVEKDTAKALRHFEEAGMSGHVMARHNVGGMEYEAGNYDFALQHWMIAAKLGHEDSLNEVKSFFMAGDATKADYAAALRGYQSAIEEMSSPDRDEAENIGS